MTGFRGSDDTLEEEIATLEGLVRVRRRRVSRELNDLERDLRALKAERARRRARAEVPAAPGEVAATTADV